MDGGSQVQEENLKHLKVKQKEAPHAFETVLLFDLAPAATVMKRLIKHRTQTRSPVKPVNRGFYLLAFRCRL